MLFLNNNDSIIVKCDTNEESLPARHLITTINVDNVYYGFYLNEKDIEHSKSTLFIGKHIDFPESLREKFNLLRNTCKLPARRGKVVKIAKSGGVRNIMVREYFKTEDDIFKTCCVFHNDKNPSLSVNLKIGVFYCFSCKTGGSITKLLNKIRS